MGTAKNVMPNFTVENLDAVSVTNEHRHQAIIAHKAFNNFALGLY